MKDCKCRSLFSTSYPWAELSYILNDVVPGYGNDYLPWLYTQPLQPKGGC